MTSCTQGEITKEMDLRAGVQAASTAVKTLAPDLAPTDFGRMVNITLQAESGGKRYGPDGKLLTSRREHGGNAGARRHQQGPRFRC